VEGRKPKFLLLSSTKNNWTHFFAEQYGCRIFHRGDDKQRRVKTCGGTPKVPHSSGTTTPALWDRFAALADGQISTQRARASSPRSGRKSAPYPRIRRAARGPRGAVVHSADWDHSIDLTGKRVALLGAAPAGSSIAPHDAEDVDGSPVLSADSPVDVPESDYTTKSGESGVRWAMRHLRLYGRWTAFLSWAGLRQKVSTLQKATEIRRSTIAVSDINARRPRMMFSSGH